MVDVLTLRIRKGDFHRHVFDVRSGGGKYEPTHLVFDAGIIDENAVRRHVAQPYHRVDSPHREVHLLAGRVDTAHPIPHLEITHGYLFPVSRARGERRG